MIAVVESIPTPPVAWSALVPILAFTGAALLLLLVSALTPRRLPRGTYAVVTVLASAVAMGGAVGTWLQVTDTAKGPYTVISGALTIDGFTAFLTVVIAAGLALSALLADGTLRRQGVHGPEPYVLLLLSASGGLVMAMANDLIVLFLGLEVLSISLYVLAGMNARRSASRESAMKYFVLGAFSSAFLLYGIALTYGATGSTNLTSIHNFLAADLPQKEGLLLAGFALLLVGLGFKVSAAPFHVWTPDVYQGAPTPITAFMASVSKAAAFGALLRVFVVTFSGYNADWQPLIAALAVLTLLVGALFAIVQDDVKRMMAYSSIGHAGFILVGVQLASQQGTSSALFYLIAYTFLVVGSFGVIAVVGGDDEGHHPLSDYRGLSSRRPGLALTFTVLLLAQAGVPLTSGFLAKFYVIGAAVQAGTYWLAVVAMLSAVIAAFLYLRIVVAMYMADPEDATDEPAAGPARRPTARLAIGVRVAVGLALAFTLVVGILPDRVVGWADDAVPVLTTVRH
ncbi:MAG TPA: NADH-quinone oxidoreductase subunit N [Acidimicrobiales bacterium]|jgi:NADH-quinone oxidoreductase subunit N